ncbi:MAG: adenylate/guanylate cyclase domain-containing protein [Chitinophagales bacterium]
MGKKDFTILYVDDEYHNLVSFKAAFRREYNVLTAQSGQEGIEKMRDNMVNLVISDQRMPQMTGVQFLEHILPEYPETIRMVLTGFSDVEAIIDAINKGQVFRYVTKPWNETELRMTIENAKQLFELQQKNKQLVKALRHKVAEQEKILRLFMKYVPEPVVQKALSESEETMFEGEQRHIAVLFCDIRGFTPLSEIIPPKEVVTLLNMYYSLMTECVKKHSGTVNQFVGDEVFATFGAPIAYSDNEKNAVFCALDMMRCLEKLNHDFAGKFDTEIKIGIGIHSGEVIAGNMGSEDRVEYSVTGDTVNTGKRIESITRDFPNSILISQVVYDEVSHLIETEAFEPLFVKGKKEQISVYKVLDTK